MKVTGFSFIKNALIFDYPIEEAIKSILPVCDEMVVAVGKSNDDTLNLIRQIDPAKIKIIETVWDEHLRDGGNVLAIETNKALAHVSEDTDWAFYIQGDEVVHEKYLDTIYEAMQRYKDETAVDGFLFKYLHFYGSYDYIGTSSRWYKNEIRIIRNDRSIFSYKDAQGFRKGHNEKLSVVPLDAYIYHYGWVKQPAAMQKKQETFHKLWHDDVWMEKNVAKTKEYDYAKNVDELSHFDGDHPEVMKKRIEEKNWVFDFPITFKKRSLKERVKKFFYSYFNVDFNYRNYKLAFGKKRKL